MPEGLYNYLTNKTWLSCVQFHLDSSQSLHGLDGTGLLGIGETKIEWASHANVRFLLQPLHKRESVTLEMRNISFQHVEMDIHDLTVAITSCTLRDSSLRINSKSIQGNSLSILNSTWDGVINSTVLTATNIDRAYINSISVKNTMFRPDETYWKWGVIIMKYVPIIVISNMTVNNTYPMQSTDMTDSNIYPSKLARNEEHVDEYAGVVKLLHSNSVVMNAITINNSAGVKGLILSHVHLCEIRSSIFSNKLDEMWDEPRGVIFSFNSNMSVVVHFTQMVLDTRGVQYVAFVPPCVTQMLPT